MFSRGKSEFRPSPDFSGVTNDIDLNTLVRLNPSTRSVQKSKNFCADVIGLVMTSSGFKDVPGIWVFLGKRLFWV